MTMTILAPLAPAQIPSVALPLEACMYCWYVLHPNLPYPATWSSTCCTGHVAWMHARRRTRLARKPVQQKEA